MIAVSPTDKVLPVVLPPVDQGAGCTAPEQNIIYLNQTDFEAFWQRVSAEAVGPSPEMRELVKNYRATVCSQ